MNIKSGGNSPAAYTARSGSRPAGTAELSPPVAEADFADLLDVEQHALADALRLDKLAALFKEGDALGQLQYPMSRSALSALLLARDVVRSGINRRVEQPRVDLAGDGVDAADALDLVPEQLNAHRGTVPYLEENLHHVAAHAG